MAIEAAMKPKVVPPVKLVGTDEEKPPVKKEIIKKIARQQMFPVGCARGSLVRLFLVL